MEVIRKHLAISRAVNAAKAEAIKAAATYIRKSAPWPAGINPDNGVPVHLDNLFNPAKFKTPNDICSIWMKVPMDINFRFYAF